MCSPENAGIVLEMPVWYWKCWYSNGDAGIGTGNACTALETVVCSPENAGIVLKMPVWYWKC